MSRRLRERLNALERAQEAAQWTPEGYAAYIAAADAECDAYTEALEAGTAARPTDPVIREAALRHPLLTREQVRRILEEP